ncbi:hypothetical protein FPSE5266_20093 [Fusarium pseudograminearum]|nr:hypothetical protein FPSE5266_20093 [Fusarium pseudograminearum]
MVAAADTHTLISTVQFQRRPAILLSFPPPPFSRLSLSHSKPLLFNSSIFRPPSPSPSTSLLFPFPIHTP